MFLLEREPKESILRSFDVSQIATYFPEFEAEITPVVRTDRYRYSASTRSSCGANWSRIRRDQR